jgi:hypothetical protein
MKYLIVVGTFDESGGKPSKIGQIVSSAIVLNRSQLKDVRVVNGGYLKEIKTLVQESSWFDVVLWFPNVVTDDQTKHVNNIKVQNKECILVTSKNNMSQKYGLPDLVQKALTQRANLFMEIQKQEELGRQVFVARLLDPLGNMFCDWTEDFSVMADAIVNRVEELSEYTRVGSYNVSKGVVLVPNKLPFFKFVRDSASRCNDLVPGTKHVKRFIGNASFRDGDWIYVSKRNVDAVSAKSTEVRYYGPHKPSVDTPIHLRLYRMYPLVNYILHGHVYLKGFPTTEEAIPCGSLEEADKIFSFYNDPIYTALGLNLYGHGFIVLGSNVLLLKDRTKHLTPRPMPELIVS